MRIIKDVLLLFCCVLFSACGGQEHFSYDSLKYAEGLRIHRGEGWIGVDVLDAWNKGKVLQRYILVSRNEELPEDLPEGTLIRTPLSRVIAFSSVHGGLFCDLNCADRMVGMCDVEYVQSDSLLQRLKTRRLHDVGSSMTVDVERIIKDQPDALFVSPFENSGYGVLNTLNLPLIECADYMETSALGRAEWMKFYGLLMGCEERADSLFCAVEKDYLSLCKQVEAIVERPGLLCDLKQGNAWYVPGGNSYIGRLLEDAGANYLFGYRKENGSVALSFESVFTKAKDADVWVIKYGSKLPYTYASLLRDFPLYVEFQPWKKRNIYGCNTFTTPFYEEIPFHPDRLLKDMVKIFHPELLPDYRLKYYFPLSE